MIFDRQAGTTVGLTENWDRSVDGLVWERDSRTLLGAIDDAGTRRVYRFRLDGGEAQGRSRRTSSFGSLALSRNGKALVAIRQSFTEPPTLVSTRRAQRRRDQAPTFNDAALAALDMGKVESVTYKGARDADIQMWVVYPPGFDATKKYPLLMLLHGGPHNAMTDAVQWRWNAQVFASWGYVVTWHNFHGSSGFGNDFTDSINPDWITLPYEDTIKAADWLMAKPFIDGERMVAAGGSYGGFLATTLLGREHPFKTLVAHAAVYNMFTQNGADYGAEKRALLQLLGKARGVREVFAAHLRRQLQDADARDPQPARPARAAQSRHRAVQHAAEARRAVEAGVFPGREPLGAEAAELAVLVPDRAGLGRDLRRARRALKEIIMKRRTLLSLAAAGALAAALPALGREDQAAEDPDPRRHPLHRPAHDGAGARARPHAHVLQSRQDQDRSVSRNRAHQGRSQWRDRRAQGSRVGCRHRQLGLRAAPRASCRPSCSRRR